MEDSGQFHVPAAVVQRKQAGRWVPRSSLGDMENMKVSDHEGNKTCILGRRFFSIVWDLV
jgi:hypothetical protein